MRKPIQIDFQRVEELAGLGLTKPQIAASLGISERTLYARQNDSEEFAKAINKGRSAAIEKASSALMSHIEKGNLTAIIFYLKTQAHWSETSKHVLEDQGAGRPMHEGMLAIYESFKNANRSG